MERRETTNLGVEEIDATDEEEGVAAAETEDTDEDDALPPSPCSWESELPPPEFLVAPTPAPTEMAMMARIATPTRIQKIFLLTPHILRSSAGSARAAS